MAVTLPEIRSYVGADTADGLDSLLEDCLAEALLLVNKFVGVAPVPEAIRDRATTEVAADLFNRRNAPHGVMNQQYTTVDGPGVEAVRISRNPMTAAYPILRPWVSPW